VGSEMCIRDSPQGVSYHYINMVAEDHSRS
jgi:hypothetical protein